MRADNYLVIVGLCILSESVDFLQRVFKNPVVLYLGKRSYSEFHSAFVLTSYAETCHATFSSSRSSSRHWVFMLRSV